MKPFGGDKECTAALTAIATTQKINLTESNEVDIDPQTISSPAAQTQKEVVALDLEEVVEQDHEEVVEQDHEENRFISSAPRL